MSEQTLDTIGKVLKGGERRDAVHFAVAPVLAGAFLKSGERVKFADGSTETVVSCGWEDTAIGVIDPFLESTYISKGERCWMFLMPNTITGLRHEWTHPAFDEQNVKVAKKKANGKEFSEQWLRQYAEKYEGDYDEMMDAAQGGEICFGSDLEYEDFRAGSEFWKHVSIVLGREFSEADIERANFRCAC